MAVALLRHGRTLVLTPVIVAILALAFRRVLDRLDDLVAVTINRDAGLVRVRVVTRWPELSVLINRRILELINTANLERRQTQAGAERRFIETRLAQAGEELHAAEAEQE